MPCSITTPPPLQSSHALNINLAVAFAKIVNFLTIKTSRPIPPASDDIAIELILYSMCMPSHSQDIIGGAMLFDEEWP